MTGDLIEGKKKIEEVIRILKSMFKKPGDNVKVEDSVTANLITKEGNGDNKDSK